MDLLYYYVMSKLDLGNCTTLTHTLHSYVGIEAWGSLLQHFHTHRQLKSFPPRSKSCKTDSLQTCMWAENFCRDFTSPSAQFTYVLQPLRSKY